MKFIYDSFDTIKSLKIPTSKQFVWLTIAIFALVIFAGIYFVLADFVFTSGYNLFYSLMW